MCFMTDNQLDQQEILVKLVVHSQLQQFRTAFNSERRIYQARTYHHHLPHNTRWSLRFCQLFWHCQFLKKNIKPFDRTGVDIFKSEVNLCFARPAFYKIGYPARLAHKIMRTFKDRSSHNENPSRSSTIQVFFVGSIYTFSGYILQLSSL